MGKNPAQKAKAQADKEKSDKVEGRATKKKVVKKKKAHLDAKTPKRGERKCKMDKCKRAYRAKGYCTFHYKEWRHGKFGRARFKQCSDQSCSRPMVVNRHGYCDEHFQNYYVKGMSVAKAAPETKDAKKEEAPAAKEAAAT